MTATDPESLASASNDAFGFPQTDLVARFEAMVAEGPERLAIDSIGLRISYAQLNAKANRIAHTLLATVPEARMPVHRPQDTPIIALFVDQGIDMAAAVLGVLKAGCAYVPLDPTYPRQLIRYMLTDARPAAIVTYARLANSASMLSENKLPNVLIETLPDSCDAHNPGLTIEPQRLAYVLYTSGSTGEPKGVMQTHRSALHNVAVHTSEFGITADDRQTLLYANSVYGSVRDTFNALLNGASLHHYTMRATGYDGLRNWLSEQRISIFCSVASVFRHFARGIEDSELSADRNRFTDLRIIKLGGEAPLPTDIEFYRNYFPDHCELSCGLGSTETGMSCRFPVIKDTFLEGTAVPLGHPVHGIEIELVDEDRKPVAAGEIGEIAIRSRYISSGYLGRQDLNSRVFTVDDTDPELRTFYSGDLAQLNADGDLMHRGRKDHQVKVRGNRVELQEVEAALETHELVRDAVVMTNKTDDASGDRLIAYVTLKDSPEGEPQNTAKDLRNHLKNRVPRFAIPNVYIHLPAMPLTANGKRNRLALRKHDAAGSTLLAAGSDMVEPADELEEKIAGAFVSALKHLAGKDGFFQGSVTHSFFDMGGDSLQAVGVLRDIEKATGHRIELASLISHPTIRQLAELLDRDTSTLDAASHEPVVVFHPKSRTRTKPPLFCLSGLGGSVLCYHNMSRRLPADQPVYGLPLPGVNLGETIFDDVGAIAAELIRRMQIVQPPGLGPYRLLGYSFGAVVANEMSQQLKNVGETVDYLGMLDCQAPRTIKSLPRRQRIRIQLRQLATMDWSARIKWLKDKVRGKYLDVADYEIEYENGGVPLEMVKQLNRLIDKSHHAYSKYTPEPQTHTPLTLFRCEERHGWMEFYEDQPDRGWTQYGNLAAIYSIPCKHLELFNSVQAEILAKQVVASLDAIGAE